MRRRCPSSSLSVSPVGGIASIFPSGTAPFRGLPQSPQCRSPPRRAETPKRLSARVTGAFFARSGGGGGWRLDIFGRRPDTRVIDCDPGFHRSGESSSGQVEKGRRDGPSRAGPAGSGGGGVGGGCGHLWVLSFEGVPAVPVSRFFRIGTVFRSGASVPSGAWVEPRLPRRSPRTVCLRRTICREVSRFDRGAWRFCSAP
jgi:hypothetical protein